jgi:hypothetical protein
LLLISHGQLALLRARWTLEQTPSDGSVTRRWPLFVLILLGTIGVTAAFLPLGGTFLLAMVLSAIIGAVMVAMLLVQRLFLLAIAWLGSLFAPNTPPPPLPPPPPPQTFQDLPQAAPAVPAWIGGSLFWVAIAALVAYATWVYFQDRGAHLRWLRWLWDALRQRLADLRRQIRLRRPAARPGLAAVGEEQGKGWRLFDGWRRGPHGPDDEVRYLYLMALQKANEAGLGRSPSETPNHFAPRLEAALGEDTEAVAATQELTDAFVEVRYARRHAIAQQVAGLRVRWDALRAALTRRKQAESQES